MGADYRVYHGISGGKAGVYQGVYQASVDPLVCSLVMMYLAERWDIVSGCRF